MRPKMTFDILFRPSDLEGDREYVLIESYADGYNAGWIATETVDDIFLLRDAIDAFIAEYKIERSKQLSIDSQVD